MIDHNKTPTQPSVMENLIVLRVVDRIWQRREVYDSRGVGEGKGVLESPWS